MGNPKKDQNFIPIKPFEYRFRLDSEFSSDKVFCMFCLNITLLSGVRSCSEQYDFLGFLSSKNELQVNSI